MKSVPVLHRVKPKDYRPANLSIQDIKRYRMPAQIAENYYERIKEDGSIQIDHTEVSTRDEYRVVYKDVPEGILYTDTWKLTLTKGWVWKSISWRD